MRKMKKYYLLPLLLLGGIFLTFGVALEKKKVWVQVGPNIRASAEIEKYGRNECWIAADLKDPDFLLGISQTFSEGGGTARICPVIVSKDGGQTWQEVTLPGGNEGFDPLVMAGPDGIMFVMLSGIYHWQGLYPRIWSTRDKGETWQGPTDVYAFSLDHPRMAVDTTGSPFNGRLYYAWNEVADTIEKGQFNIYFHYSDDKGKSFTGPIHLQKVGEGKLVMVDIVVLSDGTLIVPYYQYYWPYENKKNEKMPLWILTSTDGGRTFSGPQKVIDIGASAWLNLMKKDFPRAFALPIVAADISKESPYRDRIYIAWDDCTRTGDSNIWLIWSADKGKTWSGPVRVNDNPPAFGKGPKDYRMTPVVAVNQQGIVGVAWYDRRDDPTRRCWNYYMAFSLDGGQTFEKNIRISSSPSCPEKNTSPSIRVTNISPEPKKEQEKEEAEEEKKEELKTKTPSLEVSFDRARNVWPGHYTGLTVDVKGRFHPLWADRRSGPQQLFTTVVEVLRKPPEIPELSKEIDITNRMRVVASQANFDEEKGISTFELQIQNVSQDPIFEPLKLKVSSIERGWNNLNSMEILNSDNNEKGIGAVWDFSSLMGSKRRLDPKEITEAKKIEIKTFVERGLDGKIEFKVLGRVKE